jgi:hypothetical protein
VFVFRPGEVFGDVLVDFAAGDQLRFEGFGADAAVSQLSATQWQITYGSEYEILTFENGYQLRPSDMAFL